MTICNHKIYTHLDRSRTIETNQRESTNIINNHAVCMVIGAHAKQTKKGQNAKGTVHKMEEEGLQRNNGK